MWFLYRLIVTFVFFLAAILSAIFMYVRFSQNRYITGKEIPAEKKAQVKQQYILAPILLFGFAIFFCFFWKAPVVEKDINSTSEVTEKQSTGPKIIQFQRSDAATPKISVQTFVNNFRDVVRSFGGQFGGPNQWTSVSDINLMLVVSSNTALLLTFWNEGEAYVTGATIVYENGQNKAVINDVNILLCSLIAFFEPDILHESTLLIASELTEQKDNAQMIMATGNTYFLMREDATTQIVVILNIES